MLYKKTKQNKTLMVSMVSLKPLMVSMALDTVSIPSSTLCSGSDHVLVVEGQMTTTEGRWEMSVSPDSQFHLIQID